MRCTVVACLALALGVAGAAARADDVPAPAASPELAKVKTMVENLGYKTTLSSTGKSFEFDWPGAKYEYKIDMTTSTDGQLVYVYNYINTLAAAQMAKVPYQKLLEYENSGNVFFSMNSTPQGEDFYVNQVFGVAGLTPEFLRTQLGQFAETLDDNEALWNDKLWH